MWLLLSWLWHEIRRYKWVLGALALAACAAGWMLTAPRPAYSAKDVPDDSGDAERGRFVFAAGDCASCHASPGQSDRNRLGGGMALASPYGIFHAPNISQDKLDGIGDWSTKDLANAMLAGVSPQGEHYYPVFPYASFARMQLEDIKDLMAFLRTLPAVPGKARDHELAAPFRIRRGVGVWKLLFLDRTPIIDDPTRDASWNRGRYLSEAVAHCPECHSTRNFLGAIKPSQRYAGGPDPVSVGYFPNITPARIGGWSQAQIAEVLKSGVTPDHGRVGSSMVSVVTNLATLPQSDRDAIAAYIKSLPSRPTPQP